MSQKLRTTKQVQHIQDWQMVQTNYKNNLLQLLSACRPLRVEAASRLSLSRAQVSFKLLHSQWEATLALTCFTWRVAALCPHPSSIHSLYSPSFSPTLPHTYTHTCIQLAASNNSSVETSSSPSHRSLARLFSKHKPGKVRTISRRLTATPNAYYPSTYTAGSRRNATGLIHSWHWIEWCDAVAKGVI